MTTEIIVYQAAYFEGLKSLWEEAFPNDPLRNQAELAIPAKLQQQGDLLLVAIEGGKVIGSIMAGYDGHRGWLYAVAVSKDSQGRGIGRALVSHAECALKARGCIKVNLQVREGNPVAEFYERLGYEVEPRTSMGKAL